MRGVVAKFHIYAIKEFALPRMRRGPERAELGAIDLQVALVGDRVHRQIEPQLPEVGDPVGELDGSVGRMIGCHAAGKIGLLAAIRGVVAVDRQLDLARAGDRSVIDLDFVGLG